MSVPSDRSWQENTNQKTKETFFKKLIHRPKVEFLKKKNNKWISKSNLEFQKQRIKFGFGRVNRTKLFDELSRYNTRLRDLLDTSEKSTALKKSREGMKKSVATEALWSFWHHAKRVYDLLSEAFCCQCRHLHHAQRMLHHQTYITDIEFQIRFLYAPSLVNAAVPWTQKDVKAKRVVEEAQSGEIQLQVPILGAAPPNIASTASNIPDPLLIMDLCDAITTRKPEDNCLGHLKDDENVYSLHPSLKQFASESLQWITLGRLLSKNSPIKLNRRQRYSLALTLASSHLQLYSSSWLGLHWTKNEIIFLYSSESTDGIHLDRPYLCRPCVIKKSQPSQDPYAPTDRTLSTLGILLIELCHGMPLEEHEMRRQLVSPSLSGTTSNTTLSTATPSSNINAALDFALDLAVAMEWSRSVSGEAGERFADAVEWCLRNKLMNVKDSTWRKELFANVIEPLQFCHVQLSGK